jgi:hypothetical protein
MEEIKRFEQDGFEVRAYITPDDDANMMPYEEMHPAPDPALEADYIESYYKLKRDYENGEWEWVGVIVEARINNVALGAASIWGTDSISEEYIYNDLIPELAEDAMWEAKVQAKEISRKLGNSA